ncbi:hypothetical protein J7J13_04165 [bacterium]|nr:hypothetical protein [bacterium]
MVLRLCLKKEKNILYLIDGEKIVDQFFWKEESNISQKLLLEIDKIIKKNKLKLDGVKKLEVKSDIPASYTTVRIAKTVAKTFNYGIKVYGIKVS